MVAESALFGTAATPDLLRETDPEVLLATQAVNAAAAEIEFERDERLAKLIIRELSKAWGSK
jgi:DNA-binding protein YbaB